MKKLILAASAGLSSPYEDAEKDLDLAIVDVTEESGDRYGKAIVFSSADFNEALENADEDVSELINTESGGGEEIIGEEIEVTADKTTQVITPSEGKNAITKVTVNPEWYPTAEFSYNFSNGTSTYGDDEEAIIKSFSKIIWKQPQYTSEDFGVIQGGEGADPVPILVYLICGDSRLECYLTSTGDETFNLRTPNNEYTCEWTINEETGDDELVLSEGR